jgi:tetratricopeptide (TPR) repeat protein
VLYYKGFSVVVVLLYNKFAATKRSNYDQWIRKLAEKLGNVIFVVSGREKIDWQTADAAFWDGQVSFVPLDLLSPDFAFKYLAEIFRLTDRVEDALLMFEEAMPIAASLGIKGWLGHIHLALGNCNAELGNRTTSEEHYVKAREIYDDIGQKWGAINLEVAYQRFLALNTSVVDKDELSRLRVEADKLGYNVLTREIDGLITGNLEPIRFEYL